MQISFIISPFFSLLAEGHDSIEDAISCMELMLWKVKQDLRSSSSIRWYDYFFLLYLHW